MRAKLKGRKNEEKKQKGKSEEETRKEGRKVGMQHKMM
jgi:hypothetical protein